MSCWPSVAPSACAARAPERAGYEKHSREALRALVKRSHDARGQ